MEMETQSKKEHGTKTSSFPIYIVVRRNSIRLRFVFKVICGKSHHR